ncbi:DoxX [Planctomycetes bacterium Pan216]|uniref:DoxX n=1 Tax=Kolteria novifilia TaxID=2527975 RepID=A0A518B558_9BACT|nr:DoxX [Planctomycetes bacterium Pan216]
MNAGFLPRWQSKWMLVPRLVAALPLLILGAKHFVDPDHFENILVASRLPMVNVTLLAAPTTECAAGLLLFIGLMGRVGGLLGVATMAPAIYSTVIINGMDNEAAQNLGLSEVPFVPPLPVPVIVLLCSLLVMIVGPGGCSVDGAMRKVPAPLASEPGEGPPKKPLTD